RPFDWALGNVQQSSEVSIIAICKEQSVAWNEPDKMFERGFDGFEVFENVRVIEFEIVDDGDFRQVMNEFAALIKKRGVVFVAFDDEPFAIGETRALAEIVWNAANEIARVEPVMLEDPREQGGG